MVRLKEQLIDKLANVLDPDALQLLPGRFQTIADIMVMNLKPQLLPYQEDIANAILELLPFIKTVYLHKGGITGQFREPSEMHYVAGEQKSTVRHVENRVIYEFDIEKIMYSKGNIEERRYLPKLVVPGETIVDMFAGIGYFSLPIAVHARPACIYSIEINPVAYEFLARNVELNNVGEIVHPILGNCADVVGDLAQQGVMADRVIMGVFPAPKEYLPQALLVAKPEGGTIIHYEGVVERQEVNPLLQDVIDACASAGRQVQLREHRIVKSYGPFKYHAVLDCEIL